jgi:hypothetical protein
MKTIILLINGAATSGKDLFIDSLESSANFVVSRTSIIDPTKEIAALVGWNGKKEEKDRKFLAELKTLLDNYKGFSFQRTVDFVIQKMIAFDATLDSEIFGPKEIPHVICIITREPEDISALEAYFVGQGFQVESILIRRDEAEENMPKNHADQGIFDHNYSIHIANNGTIEDFKKAAVSAIEQLLSETENA